MPPSDYLYIFSFGYSVLIASVLLTHSLPAATCCLLIVFANSLDPGQYRQNIGPELDTDCLPSSESVSVRVFEKVNFGKKSADEIKVLK